MRMAPEEEMKIPDPGKLIPCPECGEKREECMDYWVDYVGTWHLECFECGLSWAGKEKS